MLPHVLSKALTGVVLAAHVYMYITRFMRDFMTLPANRTVGDPN